MKKLYTIILLSGILLEIILLAFFNRNISKFGPVIFWLIAVLTMLNYATIIYRLSNSVRTTKPELFKKYSFGKMVTSNALRSNEFINKLNEQENKFILEIPILKKVQLIVFILFFIASLVAVFNQ